MLTETEKASNFGTKTWMKTWKRQQNNLLKYPIHPKNKYKSTRLPSSKNNHLQLVPVPQTQLSYWKIPPVYQWRMAEHGKRPKFRHIMPQWCAFLHKLPMAVGKKSATAFCHGTTKATIYRHRSQRLKFRVIRKNHWPKNHILNN